MSFRAALLCLISLASWSTSTAQSRRVQEPEPEVGVQPATKTWSGRNIRDDPDGALRAWREGAAFESGVGIKEIAEAYAYAGYIPEMRIAYELAVQEAPCAVSKALILGDLADELRDAAEHDLALQTVCGALALRPGGQVESLLMHLEADLLSEMGRLEEADAKFAEAEELGFGLYTSFLVEHQVRAGRWEQVLEFWLEWEDMPGGCSLSSRRAEKLEMINRSLFELGRDDEVINRLEPRLWPGDPPGPRPGNWFPSANNERLHVELAFLLRASLRRSGSLEGVTGRLRSSGPPEEAFGKTLLEIDTLYRWSEIGDLDSLCRALVEVRSGDDACDRSAIKQVALQLLRAQPLLASDAAWRHIGDPNDVWLTFFLAELGDQRVLGRLREVLDRDAPFEEELSARLLSVALLGGPEAYDYLRSLSNHPSRVGLEAETLLRKYPEGSNVRREPVMIFGSFEARR